MPLVGVSPCPWEETQAATLGISSLLRDGKKVQRCRSVVVANGDKVEISRYVVYRCDGKAYVGRVEEILLEPESEASLGIVVSACKIGPDILPYGLPACAVQVHERRMVAFEVRSAVLSLEFTNSMPRN